MLILKIQFKKYFNSNFVKLIYTKYAKVQMKKTIYKNK